MEEKKKKKSPESGRKTTSSPATGTKSVGASKSAGDLRKGRATPTGKAEGATASTVKKSVSSTLVRKDAAALRKSPSTDIKKDPKGKTPPRTTSATAAKK